MKPFSLHLLWWIVSYMKNILPFFNSSCSFLFFLKRSHPLFFILYYAFFFFLTSNFSNFLFLHLILEKRKLYSKKRRRKYYKKIYENEIFVCVVKIAEYLFIGPRKTFIINLLISLLKWSVHFFTFFFSLIRFLDNICHLPPNSAIQHVSF